MSSGLRTAGSLETRVHRSVQSGLLSALCLGAFSILQPSAAKQQTGAGQDTAKFGTQCAIMGIFAKNESCSTPSSWTSAHRKTLWPVVRARQGSNSSLPHGCWNYLLALSKAPTVLQVRILYLVCVAEPSAMLHLPCPKAHYAIALLGGCLRFLPSVSPQA